MHQSGTNKFVGSQLSKREFSNFESIIAAQAVQHHHQLIKTRVQIAAAATHVFLQMFSVDSYKYQPVNVRREGTTLTLQGSPKLFNHAWFIYTQYSLSVN